ncbi:MAG: hypothetical protein JSR80_03375 [Verrucomicrobia bacterium]|nr:hypothetical protein [Verrucomicrobiota bacterium]
MIWRLLFCVLISSFALYRYVNMGNELTSLRLRLPELAEELLVQQEKNATWSYEVEYAESPVRLLHLSRSPEFSHLKYPYIDEIIEIE